MRAFPPIILLVALALLAPRAPALAQQTLAIPADSPLLDDLDHFRALGLWRGSLELRPLPRGELCRAVAAIEAKAADLAPGDRARLDRLRDYCADYGEPPEFESAAGARAPAGDGQPGRLGDELPAAYWEAGAALQFAGGPAGLDSVTDLDRRPRRDEAFAVELDAEIAGRLGVQLRVVEDYSRLSPQPGGGEWIDNMPVDARGILTDPSARTLRAVLSLGGSWYQLRLGREDRRLGQGRRGSLFLSDNPFPLDGVFFRFRTRHVAGASLFAQTQRHPHVVGAALGEDGNPEELGDAYVAAHRVELAPEGPLSLGLYEAVAYGGRGIDLAYLNPVQFLVAATQDLWDRGRADDKKVVGCDFRWQMPPCALYGEFLLDRLVTLDSAEEGEESGITSVAFLIGLRWADPLGLAGADLDVEFAHLDPQVYFHRDNDPRRAFLTDDRLDEGRLLGHWLGPNAEGLSARLSLPAAARGRWALEFEQCRWGLLDGRLGADAGFVGLRKKDKAWLVGDVAAERMLALSWDAERRLARLGGKVGARLTLARVWRSGGWEGLPADQAAAADPRLAAAAWEDDGWQLELRLRGEIRGRRWER